MTFFDDLTKTINKLHKLATEGKIDWALYNEAVEANAKLHYELLALTDRTIKLNRAYIEMIDALSGQDNRA